MKKVMNFTKAIGVFALLLLSQAMFAQKTGVSGGTLTGPTTPAVTYVSSETGVSRVETKLYQLLGTIKQNQNNPNSTAFIDADVRNQYYTILATYLRDGVSVQEAIQATGQKMYATDENIQKTLLVTLRNEALNLLRA